DDFGNEVLVNLHATGTVVVSSLTVYGNGLNPFPFDHCGPPTPTPVPATDIPPTHDGSCLLPGQPTPTPGTPVPTSTPDCGATWEHVIDFEVSNGGFYPFQGFYVGGTGWQTAQVEVPAGGYRSVVIGRDIDPTTIT